MDILEFSSKYLEGDNDNLYHWASNTIHETTFSLLRLARWIPNEAFDDYATLLKAYLEQDYTHYISLSLQERLLEVAPRDMHQLIKEKCKHETQF